MEYIESEKSELKSVDLIEMENTEKLIGTKRKFIDIPIVFRPKKKRVIIEYEPNTLDIPVSDQESFLKLSSPYITQLYSAPNVTEYTLRDFFVRDKIMPGLIQIQEKMFNIKKTSIRPCYICKKPMTKVHWFYLYQCNECGNESLKFRYASRNLHGKNALVIGGRIKLGYQIALKLLRSGCRVMITTRSVHNALEFYNQEPDYNEFKSRLFVYSKGFDLSKARESLPDLVNEFTNLFGQQQLDILIQNAAQTICFQENIDNKQQEFESLSEAEILDLVKKRGGKRLTFPPVDWRVDFAERYGRVLDRRSINTWSKNIYETSDEEIISVIQSNMIGSILIDKYLIPNMRPSEDTYVIHVHAKEGTFDTHKTMKHTHTNIAKAGLAMLTRCLAGQSENDTEPRSQWPQIHGVNPGWFSIDEYTIYARTRGKIFNPPIDEIDAASRVVHPIFFQKKSYCKSWIDYKKCHHF